MSLPSPLYLNRPDTPGPIPAAAAAPASAAAPTNASAPASAAAPGTASGFAPQPNGATAHVTASAGNAAVSSAMQSSLTQPAPAANQAAVAHPQGTAAMPLLDQPQIKAEPGFAVKAEPTTAELPASSLPVLPGTALKPEPMTSPAAVAQAAPSLVSALTAASPKDPTGDALQSLLDDGDVLMPNMPADLQAELLSSASSSFSGMTTFGTLPQQLSATFGNSIHMLTDSYAADMLSSPRFALSEEAGAAVTGGVVPAATSEAAEAAAASVAAVNAAVASDAAGAGSFNAVAGKTCSLFDDVKQVECLTMSLPVSSIAFLWYLSLEQSRAKVHRHSESGSGQA